MAVFHMFPLELICFTISLNFLRDTCCFKTSFNFMNDILHKSQLLILEYDMVSIKIMARCAPANAQLSEV